MYVTKPMYSVLKFKVKKKAVYSLNFLFFVHSPFLQHFLRLPEIISRSVFKCLIKSYKYCTV